MSTDCSISNTKQKVAAFAEPWHTTWNEWVHAQQQKMLNTKTVQIVTDFTVLLTLLFTQCTDFCDDVLMKIW